MFLDHPITSLPLSQICFSSSPIICILIGLLIYHFLFVKLGSINLVIAETRHLLHIFKDLC